MCYAPSRDNLVEELGYRHSEEHLLIPFPPINVGTKGISIDPRNGHKGFGNGLNCQVQQLSHLRDACTSQDYRVVAGVWCMKRFALREIDGGQ